MKKTTIGTRVGHGLLAVVLAATLGLVGCSDNSDDTDDSEDTATEETEETEEESEDTEEETEETEETETEETEETEESEETTEETSGAALESPSDLEIDLETGEFTFTSNDDGVAYYFLRAYTYEDGVQSTEYIATSSRITGNTTGTLSGTIDVSELGWGTYTFNLVGFAAAGSDDEDPETISVLATLGIGGVMERPELMVITDGYEAEFYIDLYTLSDWYAYQRMPTVVFNIYSDADCTELVESIEYDTSELEPEGMPPTFEGYVWTIDKTSDHLYLSSEGLSDAGIIPEVTVTDLEAGTYYVTVTALGTEDGISDSEASEAVEFTVTTDEPDGDFTATTTSLWVDPVLYDFAAQAVKGSQTDRVDFALDQETTYEIIEE